MRLSAVPASFGLPILRDGEFESLGLVSYDVPGMLVFLDGAKFLPELVANPHVSCVITTPELASGLPDRIGVAISASPRGPFYRLHNHLVDTDFYWKPFETEIAKTARVHERAYVAPTNVRIGAGCIIEPHATVLERSVLEEGCIVRAGAVIGGEGFQVARIDGHPLSVRHAGGARLEADVEVQHNSGVDRAVFGGFTVVGAESKMDNRVHVAHNCRLGKRNLLAAGAMIAGSVTSGDDVWFGPMAVISSGINIGDRASITLGAVVTRDVPADARVSGNFAIDHARFIAHMKAIAKG